MNITQQLVTAIFAGQGLSTPCAETLAGEDGDSQIFSFAEIPVQLVDQNCRCALVYLSWIFKGKLQDF